MPRGYCKPDIQSETSFETEALACGKNSVPPPGTWHFGSAYDTFTGHFGPGFGGSESASGSAGVGFGPGGTSQSYAFYGLCGVWISYASS